MEFVSEKVGMKGASLTVFFDELLIDSDDSFTGNVFTFNTIKGCAEKHKIRFTVNNPLSPCSNTQSFEYPVTLKLNGDADRTGFITVQFIVPAADLKTKFRCIGAGRREVEIVPGDGCSGNLGGDTKFKVMVINPKPKITHINLDLGSRYDTITSGKVIAFDIVRVLSSQNSYLPVIKLKGTGFVYPDSFSKITVSSPDVNNDSKAIRDINTRLDDPSYRQLANMNGTEVHIRLLLAEFSELLREARQRDNNKSRVRLKLTVTNFNRDIFDTPIIAGSSEVDLDVYNSGPLVYSVRNNTSQEPDQHPNFFAKESNQQCKIYGLNLFDTDVRIDGIAINSSNITYQTDVTLPGTLLKCEAISFTIPDQLVASARSIGGRDVFYVRKTNNQYERSFSDLFINVLHKKPVITNWSASSSLNAYNAIPSLLLQGSNFASTNPPTTVQFNNNAVAINMNPTPSFTSISANVPKVFVRAGDNSVRISNPTILGTFFNNNLVYQNRYQQSVGGGDTTITVVTQGIQPQNVRILKPQKVIYYSNQPNPYDTTFAFAGTNIYFESKVLYQNSLTDTCAHDPRTDNLLAPNTNTVVSPVINIQAAGPDTLRIVNPDGRGGLLTSNPMPFRAYDAAQLPRADSASPRQLRPAAAPSGFRISGERFDEQTLVRCTFFPLSGSPTPTDTVVVPQDRRANSSPTTIFVLPPPALVNREGILSFQALHPDTVGIKEYARVHITNRYPIIEGVSVEYEQRILTPPAICIFNINCTPTVSYVNRKSDTVKSGTGGENNRQRRFIVKGRNFRYSLKKELEPLIPNRQSQIIFNGQPLPASQHEILSDSTIGIGFSSDVPNDKYLTFVPGQYSFTMTNEEGLQSETLLKKRIVAPQPTIDVVRRLPNRVPITNNLNSTAEITLDYRDSLRVRIYSGGDQAPKAKNFVPGARVLINNQPDNGLPSTFLADASADERYALDASIPAIFLSPFHINTLVVRNLPSNTTDGGNSAPYYFRTRISYPPVRIDSVSPRRIPVDARDTLITIRGADFTPNTQVRVRVRRFDSLEVLRDGNTYPAYSSEIMPVVQRLDSTGIVVRLRAEWRDRVGIDTLFVYNPGNLPSLAQNTLLTITAEKPKITQILPDTLDSYVPYFRYEPAQLRLIGNNFINAHSVIWQTPDTTVYITPTSISDTEITINVPDSLRVKLQTVQVAVKNDIDSSLYKPLLVDFPQAQLSSATPDTINVEIEKLSALVAYALPKAGENEVNIDLSGIYSNNFDLSPNSPNPFTDKTTLHYMVPEEATIKITIIDTYHRVITELVQNHFHQEGVYSVEWNARNMPSGTYTAVLQAVLRSGQVKRRIRYMSIIR